jgi:peptide/nickel transport system ATP-binding protein
MTTLLEARNVGKVFRSGGLFAKKQFVALDDVSLNIGGGRPSITSIVGESGSGKTTLARLLLGIIQPTSGSIIYRGKDITSLARNEWRVFRREVQAIFQDPFEAYNPFYKVDHTLHLTIAKLGLASSPDKARSLIEDAVSLVGLRPEDTLGRYPHQLSGGQRQRIMVARAILGRPRIILADEPVSMVDASLRATILESLLKLNQELGISLVYITHDLTTAYQLGGSMMVLYQGAVVEVGDVELVVKNPQHPYTKVLVGAIPLPDPKLRHKREKLPSVASETDGPISVGCKFAARCPLEMPICHTTPPPFYRLEEKRAAACHLYQDAPIVSVDEIATVGT